MRRVCVLSRLDLGLFLWYGITIMRFGAFVVKLMRFI